MPHLRPVRPLILSRSPGENERSPGGIAAPGTRCSSGDTSGETRLAFRAQPAGVTEAAVSPDSLGSAETTPETSSPVSTVTVEESAPPPV